MRTEAEIKAWLTKFGYLDDDTPYSDAVIAMQQRYGLKPDGIAGPITSRAMSLFRCGHHDAKALQLPGSTDCKWEKSHLTYYHSPNFKFSNLAAKSSQDVLMQGFAIWQSYGGITFSPAKTRSSADIVIDTGKGSKYGFDGVGNVLAWAYMPCGDHDVQLQMMFDEQEPWTLSPTAAGVYSLAVVTHEIGHILGLDHDPGQGALMSPFYSASIWLPQNRDLARYRAIYGLETPAAEPAPKPVPAPLPGQSRKIKGTCTVKVGGGAVLDFEYVP